MVDLPEENYIKDEDRDIEDRLMDQVQQFH